MEKIKGKNCVAVPKNITAMFLVNRKEEAIKLAELNRHFNGELKEKYSTLDGIDYIAETILMQEQGKDISERLKIEPI